MSTLKDIGQAIKDRLETIPNIQVYTFYDLHDSINVPCALVLLGRTTFHQTMGTISNQLFRIIIAVGKPDTPSALNVLVDFIDNSGDKSVKAAIESDRRLGETVHDCIIRENLGTGTITWGGITYLATEFLLEVWA